MRTVIINTLDSELRQTPLLYLPFREDQFLWLEEPMATIENAAEAICIHSYNQGKIQDYHLVVLVSLAHYPYAKERQLRDKYKALLFMHLNTKLLLPLAEAHNLPPKAVSVVFLVPRMSDGTGGVPQGRELDVILGFHEENSKIEQLVLTADDGTTLELTEHFQHLLHDYGVSKENELSYSGSTDREYALKSFRSALEQTIKDKQRCRYIPVGQEAYREIPAEQLEFAPKTNSWDMFCVDLQMNLSDHLVDAAFGTNWRLQLQAHDDMAIQEAVSLALQRVRYLRNGAPQESYYPLNYQPATFGAEKLPNDMWKALMEKTDLPGIAELKAFMGEEMDLSVDASAEDVTLPDGKLRNAWLLFGRQKKLFEKQCAILEEQFDTEKAQAQQKTVLDTCAQRFKEWRVKVLSRIAEPAEAASEIQMPNFDRQKVEAELADAQQAYGRVCVDKLEDYDDFLQEAEQIKAEARKICRLWPGDSAAPTRRFFVFSAVLGVCFLVLMLLPYILIALGQENVKLAQYLSVPVNLCIFAGLYLAGILWWMRALCRELAECTRKMYKLLQRSHARRRMSIMQTICAYGQELPRCTICYENLQHLQTVHEDNLRRKRHFHTHMRILDKAEELLVEMHTLLRLNIDNSKKDITSKKQVNYQCAPSAPENVPCYIFLSKKWGC